MKEGSHGALEVALVAIVMVYNCCCGSARFEMDGCMGRLDLNWITEWLRDLGPLGGLLYIIVYTLRPLVLFPATPLTLYGGYVFGVFWGLIYDIIGAGAGAITFLSILRANGDEAAFNGFCEIRSCNLSIRRPRKKAFMVVLYMRLMPFFPFDGVSYGAGLSKIRFWDYTWGTLIGIIPGAVVYNVFGASLQDIGSGKFYAAVGMYIAFALIPLLLKKRQALRTRDRA